MSLQKCTVNFVQCGKEYQIKAPDSCSLPPLVTNSLNFQGSLRKAPACYPSKSSLPVWVQANIPGQEQQFTAWCTVCSEPACIYTRSFLLKTNSGCTWCNISFDVEQGLFPDYKPSFGSNLKQPLTSGQLGTSCFPTQTTLGPIFLGLLWLPVTM